MARTEHKPGKYGGYSCVPCKYYFDNFSDIFGSYPMCERKPQPDNINDVFLGDDPCEYFDFEVIIPKYQKYYRDRDVFGKD